MTTTRNIEWRTLESGETEGAKGEYDFVISGEPGDVILHVFDASSGDSDEAYLDSLQFESIDETKEAAESYSVKRGELRRFPLRGRNQLLPLESRPCLFGEADGISAAPECLAMYCPIGALKY